MEDLHIHQEQPQKEGLHKTNDHFGTKRTQKNNRLKSFNSSRPPELTIKMTQQKYNAHRDLWAQRCYTLRCFGLRSNGEHHRCFEEGPLNFSAFIQRQTRHEYLTANDWKAFWRKVDTDLNLDTVRKVLDEVENHHHHHNHDHDHDNNRRHDKERKDRNDQLDLRRGRKRSGEISSEGSENGQNNDDWAEGLYCEVDRQQLRAFRVQCNR
ncbi:MAG: hypothetical protein EZS28_014589 [Streblomastix strix]|uniref:Uncharacterized protein n=1 Tax=Streblomastix strix TaxID=222440 RepID=A0A5J4W4Q0_9EUKA|nr:MAG: hypothetical protein EZS28_014589 [Streblomastix strix]